MQGRKKKRIRKWKKAVQEVMVLSIPVWITLGFIIYWILFGYR